MLQRDEEAEKVWVDLRAHPAEPPLGRALVTMSALVALRVVKAEADEAPAEEPLPDETERWRLSLELGGVVSGRQPQRAFARRRSPSRSPSVTFSHLPRLLTHSLAFSHPSRLLSSLSPPLAFSRPLSLSLAFSHLLSPSLALSRPLSPSRR